MSALLLSASDAAERRRVVSTPGAPLAGLAASLARDLAPVAARPVWLPPNKARLTRAGGTCPRDGARLEFDPFTPRAHRCPTCGVVYDRDEDYGWWTFGYQLWLAERAVQAAALALVADDATLADFAARVLDAQADAYLAYPNVDNVLGPTRPFFSTYLESLWLVHVSTALDLLCGAAPGAYDALRARVCERVVEPSRALVASFPEGTSNRQVWHAVARLAAARLLGDARAAEDAVHGPSGLADLLGTALLADGSWFEGENYHQFAHRGFWYGLRFADRAGLVVAPDLLARYRAGYEVPFRVALPDGTLPARRDAQYGVSLRQWRWAEWGELGVADGAGPRVRGALDELYAAPTAPMPHATGRWRSTGESERNEPASTLSRADLGWKSLLFALPDLPPSNAIAAPTSELLPAQGYAVLRRDAGRVYVALDFGGGGGGHGHPDRLNVILQDGDARWLDDPGTGTYVERALHWYRSTLAHAAPLVDGRSQPRGRGDLDGYDPGPAEPDALERLIPRFAGVAARTSVGVASAERALVATDTYVVDRFTWRATRPCVIDLPFPVDGTLGDPAWQWTRFEVRGAGGLEDGFDFVRRAESVVPGVRPVRLALTPRASADVREAALWLAAPGMTLWRAIAPGPPATADRRFHAVRMHGVDGAVLAVWDLRGTIADVHADDGSITVTFADGTTDRHTVPERWRRDRARPARPAVSAPPGDEREWRIERDAAGAPRAERRLVLAAAVGVPGPRVQRTPSPDALVLPRLGAQFVPPPDGAPLTFRLGASHYLRSEASWEHAGSPTATVRVRVADAALTIDVDVRLGRAPAFAPPNVPNPLDNERADVNSDGLQLLLGSVKSPDHRASWLLVPEHPAPHVRLTRTSPDPSDATLDARWQPRADGWSMRCTFPLAEIDGDVVALDLAVNEKPPERERRRGQLVLAEPDGAFVYLRGDRMSAARALRLLLPPGAVPAL